MMQNALVVVGRGGGNERWRKKKNEDAGGKSKNY